MQGPQGPGAGGARQGQLCLFLWISLWTHYLRFGLSSYLLVLFKEFGNFWVADKLVRPLTDLSELSHRFLIAWRRERVRLRLGFLTPNGRHTKDIYQQSHSCDKNPNSTEKNPN
jgi:hypothetical protein